MSEKTHPSYGVIQFSRVSSNGTKLFMSSVKNTSTVCLKVSKASMYSDFGESRVNAEEQIVEVELSSIQFAELITTLNVGVGSPCTIRYLGGTRQPQVPEENTAIDEAKSYFKENLKKLSEEVLGSKTESILALLEKPTINKSDRESIKGWISHIKMELESNMPFYLDQYNRAAQKILAQGKAEIDATITHMITNAGLAAIKEKFPQIELGSSNDDNA